MSTLPRSSTLSREGRDTLWLLGVLALSIAPHVGRLPLWCTLGTTAAIVWRGRMAWRDGPLPPRVVLLVCLAISMGVTFATFHSIFGREAGVTLVTLLAGLKTLELRARRDAFVVTSLGFFLILTQFLYSQSLPIAVLMLLVLIGLLTSLVLAQRPTGRPSIVSAIKVACRSVVMGIPVMLALFILFPRLGPLWSVPADAGQHTGLSDRINLGKVAELAQDETIALRVRFWGPPPPQRDLYFRGPVLDFFDGRTWQSSMGKTLPPQDSDDEVHPAGQAYSYQVTLEPSRIATVPLIEGTLFASPTPPSNEPQLRRIGLSWLATRPMTERAQIDARAWHRVQHGPTEPEPQLRNWLQLPSGFNPRTLQWAQALRSQPELASADPRALSDAVMRHVREGSYIYTLAPGDEADENDPSARNLIDRFWLDRKTGFCEHFATAYVTIMRAMGVPSRVITGFQGAELNAVDGLYVVRNSDAHAWAEYWQPGEGWVRADPTAAVAPERVERPRPVFRNGKALPGPLSNIDPAVWGRLRDYIEAGNNRWNVWVLQYSRSRQLEMLKNWGFDSPSWMDLIRLCAVMLTAIAMLGIGWLWWTRPKVARTPWRRPLMRVHRALVAAGLPAPESSPAPAPTLSWAGRIQSLRAPPRLLAIQAQLCEVLTELDAMRYGPPDEKGAPHVRQQRKRLIQKVEQLAQQWRAQMRRAEAHSSV